MGDSCQVLHGGKWIPAKILFKSEKGWKVFIYIGTGMEKYITNPDDIKV